MICWWHFFPNENRLWIIILNTHQFHEKIAGFSIKKKLGTTPHWLKQYLDDEKDDYVVDDLVIWQVCTYLRNPGFFNILGEMKQKVIPNIRVSENPNFG